MKTKFYFLPLLVKLSTGTVVISAFKYYDQTVVKKIRYDDVVLVNGYLQGDSLSVSFD